MDGDGGWGEAVVSWGGPDSRDPPVESLRPLSDPVIKACLAAALEEGTDGEGRTPTPSFLTRLADFAVGEGPPPWGARPPTHPASAACLFLPTGAARLFAAAAAAFPSHTLLAFDFDELPTTLVNGRRVGPSFCWGAPVVSGPPSPGAPAIDYPSITSAPPGTADILFPSDFHLLARLATHIEGGHEKGRRVRARVLKSADFMRAHSPDLTATSTALGYNPLIDDFRNTAALVVERGR
jgi:hypothetical protein